MADQHDLNARQLRFALGILEGKPAGRAYEDAGYKARGPEADAAASRLLRNAKVADFLDRQQAKATDKALITRERVVTGLLTIAEGEGADSARVKAWELLGKDIGMWKEANDRDEGEFNDWLQQLEDARQRYGDA